jgi:hypothetical protein
MHRYLSLFQPHSRHRISASVRGFALQGVQRVGIGAIVPPRLIVGSEQEVALALLLTLTVRTQPLQIAHRVRFALGYRLTVEVQQRHSFEQLLCRIGSEFGHMAQIAGRKADVSRDACDFLTIAGVESLAALADQLAMTGPIAKYPQE